MKLVERLRPVEAKFLTEFEKDNSLNSENALDLILSYLAIKGYLKVNKNEFTATEKKGNLRDYENKIISIVYDHNKSLENKELDNFELSLGYYINDYSFNDDMVNFGIFNKSKIEKRFLFVFKLRDTVYNPTEKFKEIISDLSELEKTITFKLKSGEKITKKELGMAYAFFGNRLIKDFDKTLLPYKEIFKTSSLLSSEVVDYTRKYMFNLMQPYNRFDNLF